MSQSSPEVDVADGKVTWQGVKRAIAAIAVDRGHIFGYPMFDDDKELVLAPRFPLPEANGFKFNSPSEEQLAEEVELQAAMALVNERLELVNSWPTPDGEVLVVRDKVTGKSHGRVIRYNVRSVMLSRYIHTIGTSVHHDLEAEQRALSKLEALIGEHRFRHYYLTGMFFESSKRSQCVYVFRRCRPTIACTMSSGSLRPLCTLCMHPLGHYAETYQGVMVPTDDVIAHLVMMRGDEKMYWRKANQHCLNNQLASAF